MTAQELINLLETAPNKALPIFAYVGDDVNIEDSNMIDSMDTTIPDRIDLNIRALRGEDFQKIWPDNL